MKKIGTILISIIMVALVVFEALLIGNMAKLNVLPGLYFGAMIGGLLLATLIIAAIAYLKLPEAPSVIRAIRRLFAGFLAIILMVISFYGARVTNKIDKTISEVTTHKLITEVYGVYVLNEDPAQSLEEAKDYKFGIVKNVVEGENDKVMATLESIAGSTLDFKDYSDVTVMAEALYNQKAQAIIVSDAFLSLLQDQEEYADFNDKARLLYEFYFEEEELYADESSKERDFSKPFIFYLSGNDTRSELLTTSRSDVNIIATVNPQTRQILLVNTPRDYYVPISVGGGALDKLTHCGIYGMQCSIDTLNDLYDISIDGYAQINFTGFKKLIDTIGGVTIYSERSYNKPIGIVMIHEGENYLNGEEALAFARERKNLPDGDNDRGRNQMRVIKAAINKMATIESVLNLPQIIASLDGLFLTDVTSDEISLFTKEQLSSLQGWDIHSYAVTGENARGYTYSMPKYNLFVMYPHQDAVDYAKELMDRVLNGDILTEEDMIMPKK